MTDDEQMILDNVLDQAKFSGSGMELDDSTITKISKDERVLKDIEKIDELNRQYHDIEYLSENMFDDLVDYISEKYGEENENV